MPPVTATVAPPGGALDARPAPPTAATRARNRLAALPPATWLALVLAVGLATAITSPAWGGRPIAGEDVMYHLVRADFGLSRLFAHGRVDGWLPRFDLGFDEFLLNGPGLTGLVAAVRVATAGLFSNTGALKVVGIGSYVAFPLAFAFLARSFGLGRRAAGIAAILSLLVSSPFGLGLHGIFSTGLLAHQAGAIFWALAFGALLRVPVDPRARWVVLGGLSAGALAIVHVQSLAFLAFMLVVALVCLLHTDEVTWAALGRLGTAAALGAGSVAFWIVPRLAHGDLQGEFTGWGTQHIGQRVQAILDGEILFRPHVAYVVLAAFAYAGYRVVRRQRYTLAIVAVPVVTLVVAHWALHRAPGQLGEYEIANRVLGYVGVLATLPLAALLGDASRVATRRRRGADLAVVVIVAGVVLASQGPWRDVPRQFGEPTPTMRAAAVELERVVPPQARFAVQRDYPSEIERTGVIHPETWLAWASGRNLLDVYGIEASVVLSGPFVPYELGTAPPESSADRLAVLGVTHVVTTTNDLAVKLDASGRFVTVWQRAPIAILRVVGPAGRPAPATLLSTDVPAHAHVLAASPEHLRVRFDTTSATVGRLAIAWSPKWHGRLDGRPVELRHAAASLRPDDNVLELDLPAGTHTIEVDYRSDGWDHTGVAISVATLAALLVWCVRRRVRRRRPRAPAPDPRPSPSTAAGVSGRSAAP